MNIKPNHKRPAIIAGVTTVVSACLFAVSIAGQTPSTILSLALILVVAVPSFASVLAFTWNAGR